MGKTKRVVRSAASQSFTSVEVSWLDQLLRKIREGSDTKILMRQPAAASVQRKIATMQKRVELVNRMRAQKREPA